MLIEDKHKCEDCNKIFGWYYHVPQRWDSDFKAEILPKGKAAVRTVDKRIEKNGYFIPLRVSVHCLNCDYLNSFDVKEVK